MNRILFFVHYNKYDKVSGYIFYLLKNIRKLFSRIIFISNSPLDDANYRLLTEVSDKIIIRKNRGFDFGAWKDALFEETWDNLIQYDNVTLMNDSCFGPLYDMTAIYEKMEKNDVDFWGLTNHRKTKHGIPQMSRAIPEYIQSYFICFHTTVLKSMVFRKFWDTIHCFDDADKVLRCYETQLTTLLFQCGFTYSVYFDTTIFNNIDNIEYDIAKLHPNLILKNNIPLLKIKSFVHFPFPGYIIDCIKDTTHYPVPLITEYFDQIYDPNTNIALYDKSIMTDHEQKHQDYSSLKIAVYVHVYYVDLLHEFIAYFNAFNFIYDLYITTDSIEKKEAIDSLLTNNLLNCSLKETVIFENKGRDILPWLRLSNRLDKYDIVGHFHTKKTTQEKEWIGSIWRQELLGHLLLPIHSILSAFMDNAQIGVIIPEIPSCFHDLEINLDEMGYIKKLNELWKEMGCRKKLSFDTLLTVIMSYGTMFWYRPNALKQLFDLNLTSKDFPNEPIPNDGTIAHCIERLIVYTAWNNDYDFRIVASNHTYTNSFTDNMMLNKHILSLKQSKTYRAGKLVLFLPKLLKSFIKKIL